MDCNCDQKWPIEPWAIPQRHQPFLSDQPFVSGRDPKVASGSAVLTWAEEVEMAFSVLIQIGASPLIMLYDPSHSAARQKPQSLHILQRDIQIPDFIIDPSPATFHLACLVYAFPLAAFYRLHPNDRYQPRFLLFAICFATFISAADIQNMRRWLPLTITTALLLSAFLHHTLPHWKVEAVEEVERVGCKHDGFQCQEKQSEAISRC